MCTRGASAIAQLMAEFPAAPLHAFVVWEPVIATDVAPPTTGVLRLVPDARARQYWDPELALGARIVRDVNRDPTRYGFDEPLPEDFIVWDAVAVFGPGPRWTAELPVPLYQGAPVVEVIAEARAALQSALAMRESRAWPSSGASPP